MQFRVQESLRLENNIENKQQLKRGLHNKERLHQQQTFLHSHMASPKEIRSQTIDFHLIVNTTHYSLVETGKVRALAVMRDCYLMAVACSQMYQTLMVVWLMSQAAAIRFKETLIMKVSIRERLMSNTSRSSRRKATRTSSTSPSRYLSSQSNLKFTHVSIHRQNGRRKRKRQGSGESRSYSSQATHRLTTTSRSEAYS